MHNTKKFLEKFKTNKPAPAPKSPLPSSTTTKPSSDSKKPQQLSTNLTQSTPTDPIPPSPHILNSLALLLASYSQQQNSPAVSTKLSPRFCAQEKLTLAQLAQLKQHQSKGIKTAQSTSTVSDPTTLQLRYDPLRLRSEINSSQSQSSKLDSNSNKKLPNPPSTLESFISTPLQPTDPILIYFLSQQLHHLVTERGLLQFCLRRFRSQLRRQPYFSFILRVLRKTNNAIAAVQAFLASNYTIVYAINEAVQSEQMRSKLSKAQGAKVSLTGNSVPGGDTHYQDMFGFQYGDLVYQQMAEVFLTQRIPHKIHSLIHDLIAVLVAGVKTVPQLTQMIFATYLLPFCYTCTAVIARIVRIARHLMLLLYPLYISTTPLNCDKQVSDSAQISSTSSTTTESTQLNTTININSSTNSTNSPIISNTNSNANTTNYSNQEICAPHIWHQILRFQLELPLIQAAVFEPFFSATSNSQLSQQHPQSKASNQSNHQITDLAPPQLPFQIMQSTLYDHNHLQNHQPLITLKTAGKSENKSNFHQTAKTQLPRQSTTFTTSPRTFHQYFHHVKTILPIISKNPFFSTSISRFNSAPTTHQTTVLCKSPNFPSNHPLSSSKQTQLSTTTTHAIRFLASISAISPLSPRIHDSNSNIVSKTSHKLVTSALAQIPFTAQIKSTLSTLISNSLPYSPCVPNEHLYYDPLVDSDGKSIEKYNQNGDKSEPQIPPQIRSLSSTIHAHQPSTQPTINYMHAQEILLYLLSTTQANTPNQLPTDSPYAALLHQSSSEPSNPRLSSTTYDTNQNKFLSNEAIHTHFPYHWYLFATSQLIKSPNQANAHSARNVQQLENNVAKVRETSPNLSLQGDYTQYDWIKCTNDLKRINPQSIHLPPSNVLQNSAHQQQTSISILTSLESKMRFKTKPNRQKVGHTSRMNNTVGSNARRSGFDAKNDKAESIVQLAESKPQKTAQNDAFQSIPSISSKQQPNQSKPIKTDYFPTMADSDGDNDEDGPGNTALQHKSSQLDLKIAQTDQKLSKTASKLPINDETTKKLIESESSIKNSKRLKIRNEQYHHANQPLSSTTLAPTQLSTECDSEVKHVKRQKVANTTPASKSPKPSNPLLLNPTSDNPLVSIGSKSLVDQKTTTNSEVKSNPFVSTLSTKSGQKPSKKARFP